MSEALIPKHGGYRKLKSFQVAHLVYDVTVRFVVRYVDSRSRTCDQMVQAARSGVQNIAEGSQASGTSRKMELKLTNVARASLEELRLDYEDFLRQKGLAIWAPTDHRRSALIAARPQGVDAVANWVRWIWGVERQNGPHGPNGPHGHEPGQDGRAGLAGPEQGRQPLRGNGQRGSTPSMPSMPSIESPPNRPASFPEIAANGALALLAVACSLLDRQIAAQARRFETEGGFTERLYRVRTARRSRS